MYYGCMAESAKLLSHSDIYLAGDIYVGLDFHHHRLNLNLHHCARNCGSVAI